MKGVSLGDSMGQVQGEVQIRSGRQSHVAVSIWSGKQMGVEQNIYMDKEAQIRAIEKTFEDTKEDITEHHTEKGVYPVEVLPILPDDDMWKFPCAQVK